MATYNSFDVGNFNKYEFTLDSYQGTGGYLNGAYLFKHSRELDFESRVKQSYYKNYLKGILDSVISPVFSQNALRETDNEIFNAFIDNVDVNGTSLQQFTKNAVTMSRLLGTVFVVMDNFTNTPKTQKEIIDNRQYPYIYTKLPQDVYSYKIDKFGRLQSITFFMEEDEEGVREYVYWDKDSYHRYKKYSGDIKTIQKETHDIGEIPVIQLNSTEDGLILPQPPFYDLARINMTIFNQDSEQRDLERIQSFSVLVVPGTEPDQNIEIGSHNLIFIDENASQSPKYIAPDPDVLKTLRTSSEHNIDALITMANVLGATAVNNGNSTKSGIAMSYEFLGQNYQLMETAGYATDLEINISNMFGKFINQDIEYSVIYKSDYVPTPTAVKAKLDILQLLTTEFEEYISEEQKEDINNSIAQMLKYATSV